MVATGNADQLFLGLDVGGTHVTTATVRPAASGYDVGEPQRFDVDSTRDADSILGELAGAIRSTIDPASVAGIGIAMPGPFDYPRGISLIRGLAKFDALYGMDVGAALRGRLDLGAEKPIVFGNDCNAFVLGEWLAGAAVGRKHVIGFTLGTGFGSGFLADGGIVQDGDGLPPDTTLGFVPYREGIAEDYISRRGLRKLYVLAGGAEAYDVADIARAARDGEERALALFNELGVMTAEVVAPFAKTFSADAIVIGGSISRSYDLFRGPLESGMPAGVVITLAGLPHTAGLIGAAELARRSLEPGR